MLVGTTSAAHGLQLVVQVSRSESLAAFQLTDDTTLGKCPPVAGIQNPRPALCARMHARVLFCGAGAHVSSCRAHASHGKLASKDGVRARSAASARHLALETVRTELCAVHPHSEDTEHLPPGGPKAPRIRVPTNNQPLNRLACPAYATGQRPTYMAVTPSTTRTIKTKVKSNQPRSADSRYANAQAIETHHAAV